MERVRRIGESRWPVTAGLIFVDMRVEYDVRAVPGRPAHRFRIAPAFVTDGDTEGHRPGLKNTPAGARRIRAVLGRIALPLILEPGDFSVPIDDQPRGPQQVVDD